MGVGALEDHCTDGDPGSTPCSSYETIQCPLDSLLATTSQTGPEKASGKTGQEKCENDGVCLHKVYQLCAQKAFPAREEEVHTQTASKDRSQRSHWEDIG